MKKDIIDKKFQFFLQEVEKHFYILDKDLNDIKPFYPLSEKEIEKFVNDENYLKILDQIAYRYIKLQDTLGKIIRTFLLKEGELIEHLTMIDVIHKAEKIGIFIDEEFWFEMRNLRNSITHEYPYMYGEVAEAINTLFSYMGKIKEIIDSIKERA